MRIKMPKFVIIALILTFVLPQMAKSQSFIDDLEEDTSFFDSPNNSVFKETISKISNSGRIFIITNDNEEMKPGDFISFVQFNKLSARALVAKVSNGIAGVKITKIYDLDLWEQIRSGIEIDIIKGDDSYFLTKKAEPTSEFEEEEDLTISQDLFDEEQLIEDQLAIDDESVKKILKQDNIISMSYGMISGVDSTGGSKSYGQPSILWAYQVYENIFIEGYLGQTAINDFPSLGLDTNVYQFVLRGKLSFTAPFDSVLQPYVGFLMSISDSPGAGKPGDGKSQEDLNKELDYLAKTDKKTYAFGVTVLKRLVPGWFLRADIGTDIISGGIALEF